MTQSRRSAMPIYHALAVACLLIVFSTSCSNQSATKPTTEDSNAAGETVVSSETSADQALRHAVFFKFKDTSSPEDVQTVVDAFAALPTKIDAIKDFEWGTNNSPEGKDDGFTHCFFITFADEKGREEYLPHAEHMNFVDTLLSHLDKVFVLDYWGNPSEPAEKELRHAVFFKFKDDAAPEDVAKAEQAFAALPEKIDAIKAFEWGTNNSPESHDEGFTHCFFITFDSEEGRDEYLPHPDHLALVEVLIPVLDKVRVLDYWAQK